ncbi:unnamed protein product [Schistocephalus solidus]|uniref:Uncharacterized protein n=1 Tax=Schistocephalus solidus TaxID=70667 RepID=A0A3P7DEE2_SCHSO|nr:unnamed protein product [Schistocephalus solidus]
MASCILLIEEFRNQEKPPNKVLIFTKLFGLLAMGLWVAGNVIPMLLLVVTHVKLLAWQRKSVESGHQPLQNRNAIALFLLFLISQSFCLWTMRGHGSWAEMGSSLAYTLAVPALCLLTGLLFLNLRW